MATREPPHVFVDFPNAAGISERLTFTQPLEIISANAVGEVRAALDRVERRAMDGYFAVGFVAYDAAPAFDSALRVGGRAPTPLLWFGIYDAVPATGTDSPREHGTIEGLSAEWRPHVTRAHYEAAIGRIRSSIAEGSFYQVNHTIRLRSEFKGDPVSAYEALRAAQPESYGMCIDTGRFQLLSVSPELFFARKGRDITARPMKGTTRRGRWSDEDEACAAALIASDKDRAENVMIVDLVRSDLGRISELGSVAVPHLFQVERHPTLWQMTSTITARVRSEIRLPEIFDALFPSGSVVGAPKVAAASWIAENEAAPRGVYCGAMGIVRPGGDCTFNVAIRTLVLDSETGVAEYGAGGGITIDSTAAGEYDELLAKSAVLHGAIPEFDLLETMRLTDGTYTRRDRHIRRLTASADYFGFSGTSTDVSRSANSALDECARSNPSGDHRVRLLLSRRGAARTETIAFLSSGTSIDTPVRCVIARLPVSSADIFLFHKTTHREAYDERRAAHPEADEVILVNERGELTECSIGNLVVELNGERVTPPRDCGLLAGVFREELLDDGVIRERVLYPSDIAAATRLWRVNSLRGWTELVMELSDPRPSPSPVPLRPSVRGVNLDLNTRCAHYHSDRDIIAIKLWCCGEYFACKECHDELADHELKAWPVAEYDTQAVLCGACGHELTINEYLASGNRCPGCAAAFNPGCRSHYHFYFSGSAPWRGGGK